MSCELVRGLEAPQDIDSLGIRRGYTVSGSSKYQASYFEGYLGILLLTRLLLFTLGPAAVRYGTHPFLDGDESIARDLLESFVEPTWPIHVDVGRSRVPQTEMQAGIAAREKAGLTQDRLRLCLASIMDQHSSSNGASIRLYTFQFHFDPVGLPAEVIAQQRRGLVEIDN